MWYELDENKKPVVLPRGAYPDFKKDNTLEKTEVCYLDKRYIVSTVFLRLDHAFSSSKPILFETMIFTDADDSLDQYMWRYTSHDDAIQFHHRIVECLRKGLDPRDLDLINDEL